MQEQTHTPSSTRPESRSAVRHTTLPDAWAYRVDTVREIIPGLVVLAIGALIATMAAGLSSTLSPLVVGVVLGAVAVNIATPPAILNAGITFGAKKLLRVGIVVLGLRLSIGDLVDLGGTGLIVVAGVVATTFFGTQYIGRRLGLTDDMSLLVATGYSICGASAIAAMDGLIDADEEEATYAITLVTLCGSLSILVLPLLGHVLGLDSETFGTFVGGAVHDVGQVVATASTRDDTALAAATVVKLSRVMLLAPIVAFVAFGVRRRHAGTDSTSKRPPLLPVFVIGFLGAVCVRSTEVLSGEWIDAAARIEKLLLTIALVGLGAGVRFRKMSRLGIRPLMLGAISWVLVASAALLGSVLTT